MKRYFAFLLLLMAVTLASAQNHPVFCGDANNDGKVDVGDIQTIERHILQNTELNKVSYDSLDITALPLTHSIRIVQKDNSIITIAIADIEKLEILAVSANPDDIGEGGGNNPGDTGEGGENNPDQGGNNPGEGGENNPGTPDQGREEEKPNPAPTIPEEKQDDSSSEASGNIDIMPWD